MATRLPTIAALTDAGALSGVFGKVARVHTAPLAASGFSGARLERVTLQTIDGRRRGAVLKHVVPERDWLAVRSGDRVGREAAMLGEPALRDVDRCFRGAVLAYATEPGAFALLMEDLTADLLPDERAPLRPEQECAIVASLARLHARFWEDPALSGVGWLARAHDATDWLAPSVVDDARTLAVMPAALRERVIEGWASVRRHLPPGVLAALAEPGRELVARHADLPTTLLHGDVKIANFALRPDGVVTAIDWAEIGTGPCTLDLGWYLAVNASRLTGSKEALIAAYRGALESDLGRTVDDSTWQRMLALGILSGARALLWSKALALDAGSDAARDEWAWWEARLLEMRGPIG